MFEKASRVKFRFSTSVGNLTTEDLWDLPLTSSKGVSLDGIAMELHKNITLSEEVSFVKKKTVGEKTKSLKLEIVKHIIKTRIEESEAKTQSVKNKAKKDKILGILAKKEDEELMGASEEDLHKMLEEM
jgi:hypothetical protein